MVNVKRPRLAARSLIPNGDFSTGGCVLPGENPPLIGPLLDPAADRSRRGGRSTEQALEEGRAGGEAAIVAGEADARRQGGGARLAAIARLRMGDDVLQVAGVRRLEHRDHGGVAA